MTDPSVSAPPADELPKLNKPHRKGPAECAICYRPADGYHCGVPSCKACKTFFRRMCVSKTNVFCSTDNNCFHISRKSSVNIRCQSCRYAQCIKVGMNPFALELKEKEKKVFSLKESSFKKSSELVSIDSKEFLFKNTINRLTHLEMRLEMFRISAYNPNYLELGNLKEMVQCTSRLSEADKFGPMPGWPFQRHQTVNDSISMKSKIRDVPDEQPPLFADRKVWMLFNTFTTIEYAKTFPFYESLELKDKIVLVGYTTLVCMSLHCSYFAISKKIDGCVQPDGLESPQKDEGHYFLTAMAFAPLIRCNIQFEEYVLLKAICFCNPTIHGLSNYAQMILTRERRHYGETLFDLCRRTQKNGPVRFMELLGIIPVLEQQQQAHKQFYILNLVPILAKYNRVAQFLDDIMFS